jgi:SPX domain protein involved in polyphosphate accumulation
LIRRFNRFELKYFISTRTRDLLWQEMRSNMSLDREGDEEGGYQVTSLYHDTYDLACYRAKIDGLNFRRKLRVRRYGTTVAGTNPPVMVEIKQRINRTTQKRRVALPLDEAYALCEGRLERSFEDPLDKAVADEVTYLVLTMQLAPKCVISYKRKALVGSAFEPGLRVTFDEHLTVNDARNGLSTEGEPQRFIPPDRAVLEVKSNDVVPIWLSRLLAASSCQLVRFSKYCAGIAHLRKGIRWTS